ncbi:hypothetical protein [Mycobacteroides abscessus]|uniref:hypothetical protein n=1 Tax=Mycobacteroides abscessus TaxID=36809 RepID=UPI0013FD0831|nr:hypothetical protein [Mycobacteroides abscessus]
MVRTGLAVVASPGYLLGLINEVRGVREAQDDSVAGGGKLAGLLALNPDVRKPFLALQLAQCAQLAQ